MADSMRVDIVSPEKVLFSGEANMVITRTNGGGEIAFQAGHAPFLGALVENHTRIFLTDGKIQDVAVHRGFVEVSGNTVSILSDVAELADEIDVARAKQALERHEMTLKTETVEANIADAVAGKARARARLTTTGTSFTA
ncbi:ATP synthase F1 subunit epsilon [Ilumatobacter coccineus]|jgi:F-type H+-transporting ATPase subunit epsilon|uniref:ATP synthase epsilon chain n=1 Tax=Ilumatobacter coccineus (strain NBRC 103263 / KCTC 29153 / YM16-304) TaxID=1313172 RepID=A0A6C7E400_ILUCY|nr:ATP synthase F1 subunit epsilon [Ilumatobacter coccineus]BAN01381.1 putative ATP synthase subunit epsilon [Ilumatobacter coccineus YM16-304]